MIQVPFGAAEWQSIAPFAIVALGGMVALLYAVFAEERPDTTSVMWMSQAGVFAGLVATLVLWGSDRSSFGATFAIDGLALFSNLVFLLAASMSMFMAQGYLEMIGVRAREFYPLVLFATAGMMIMAASRDLVLLFLGIEVMSLSAYVLAGIHRRDRASGEASLKYFILGAFATCFLLYGIAAFYGATGATSYDGIRAGLGTAPRVAVLGGLALLIVALGFKAAIVPFQFWTPDVYQGAPSAVTAFMAVGVKAAAFAGIARLFLTALAPLHLDWQKVLWVLAIATMTVGNVLALVQSNVKRMLAYSSIAHAGYLLTGVVVGTSRGGAALLFYLLTYAFTTLGAFGGVIALGVRGDTNENLEDWRGLAERRPLLAGAMTIFLLSLKAGGVGLNLTAANHVFHFDRWWNPAVENQATDRAFRIGQHRTVNVHKMMSTGTLEQQIDLMIEQKTELAKQIIGTGEQWLTELSIGQLRDLLSLRRDGVEDDD